VRTRAGSSLFDPVIVHRALIDAFVKLDPRHMARNPVMFLVEVGSAATTVAYFVHPSVFVLAVTLWLWATVLFANFAEAIAEGRGKAQADTLRRTRQETTAFLRRPDGTVDEIPSSELQVGDLCVVVAGQVIPGDGDVSEGIATVDESAITGESAPVIRESGGDRCAVTGGTVVLSDRIVVRITSKPGETFLDRMILLVEEADRQKTPNEVALEILIFGLTLILLVAVATLEPMAIYSKAVQSVTVLIALFVCLAPTTIGGLLSAIGIADMDRLVQRNVLAMSGRAVEAAGDCTTLLLDKTGTITYGNRMAAELVAVEGTSETDLAEAALLSSLADETPEGRSIVALCEARYGVDEPEIGGAGLVAFTAQTRMSGIDQNGRRIRKGATDSVRQWVEDLGGSVPGDLAPIVERVAGSGGTPLVVADGPRVLGVIELKDTVKPGMVERFDQGVLDRDSGVEPRPRSGHGVDGYGRVRAEAVELPVGDGSFGHGVGVADVGAARVPLVALTGGGTGDRYSLRIDRDTRLVGRSGERIGHGRLALAPYGVDSRDEADEQRVRRTEVRGGRGRGVVAGPRRRRAGLEVPGQRVATVVGEALAEEGRSHELAVSIDERSVRLVVELDGGEAGEDEGVAEAEDERQTEDHDQAGDELPAHVSAARWRSR
jgi:K+-transporting ATPase ATPase B chain